MRQDNGRFCTYDGVNFWADLYAPSGGGGGTITGVTAGTGLSGGGTTGNVTLSLQTPVTVADGGTGTATPSLVAGTGIAISGTWPDQTVAATGGGSGVSQIIAGTNVTISPSGGTGVVTVNATGGGGSGYLKGTVTINLTATSGTFYGTTTITGANTGMGAAIYCPELGILSPTGPVAFIQGNMTACINSANTVTCAVTISGFTSAPGNVTFPVVVFA